MVLYNILLMQQQLSVSIESEQLKKKYKKSLQQLMLILKVNKSLKQSLQLTSSQKDAEIANLNYRLRENEIELENYQRVCGEYKTKISLDEAARDRLVNQYQNMKRQVDQIGRREEENRVVGSNARHQGSPKRNQSSHVQSSSGIQVGNEYYDQLIKVRSENQLLRKRLGPSLGQRQQRGQLMRQMQKLKQQVGWLSQQLLQQKERNRNQLLSKQTQFLRSKSTQSQRLMTIQSKYQLLQNQLNNYKNIEKYLEDEAVNLVNEEHIFNSIKQQMQRINLDFQRCQMESRNILSRKHQEDAAKDRKIVQLQSALNAKQEQNQELRNQIAQMQTRKDNKNSTFLLQKLQQEKQNLQERVCVLQALTATQPHRASSGLTDRIKQFQYRVQLLMEQAPKKQTYGGLQQIVVLKGYVMQLSQQLNKSKKKQQHLQRKIRGYKDRQQQSARAKQSLVKQFKRKASGYDVLVGKLYGLLQQKMKEKVPQDMQKEFTNALAHYEDKMIAMSEEIVLLRNQKELIQSEIQDKRPSSQIQDRRLQIDLRQKRLQSQTLQRKTEEEGNRIYLQRIRDLTGKVDSMETHIEGLRLQTLQLQRLQHQNMQKDRTIEQMGRQLREASRKVVASSQGQTEQQYNTLQIRKLQHQTQQKDRKIEQMSRQLRQANRKIQSSSHGQVQRQQYQISQINKLQNQNAQKDRKIKQMDGQLRQANVKVASYGKFLVQRQQLVNKLSAQQQQLQYYKKQLTALNSRLIQSSQTKVYSIPTKQSPKSQSSPTVSKQIQLLRSQNSSKHQQLVQNYHQLQQKTQRIAQLQAQLQIALRQKAQLQYRYEAAHKEFVETVTSLRAGNVALQSEIQANQSFIGELKHRIFGYQLQEFRDKQQQSAHMTRDSYMNHSEQPRMDNSDHTHTNGSGHRHRKRKNSGQVMVDSSTQPVSLGVWHSQPPDVTDSNRFSQLRAQ